MRPLRLRLSVLVIGWAAVVAVGAQGRTPPSDAQLRAAVTRSLQDHRLQRGKDPQVDVSGGIVTLRGQVRSLWEKDETIKWARAVEGVTTLVSDLVIARAESDKKISDAIGDRVLHYGRFTVFDDISARVRDGVVTLEGVVTAQAKANDIQDMTSRIQGVQALRNQIRVYQTSQSDDQLRATIARQIFQDADLERYARESNPPIRIIVEHGQVTLKGFVYAALDKQRIDAIVRPIFGILKLENQLQVVR